MNEQRSVSKLRTAALALCATACLTAFGSGAAWSETKLDPESQKLYDEAVKVIPGLPVEIFAGAQAEGEVMLYRLGQDFPGAVYPEFRKLFPFIEINEFEATVAPLLQRFAAEARSGRNIADVVMNAIPGTVDEFDEEGLVMHYVPTSADAIKAGFHEGVYYPHDQIKLCNAWNSDLVSDEEAEVLGEWKGIADPKWTGKSGINQLGTGGLTALAYTFMDSTGVATFDTLIVDQKASIFPSVPAMVERLAAGGISVAYFVNDGNLYKLKKAGAPLKWKCPTPGVALNDFQFIPAKAPHPNAAKLWIEFMLSKKGQEIVGAGLGLGPARSDVADTRPVASEPWYSAPTELYSYTWPDIMEKLPDVKAKWDAAVEKAK